MINHAVIIISKLSSMRNFYFILLSIIFITKAKAQCDTFDYRVLYMLHYQLDSTKTEKDLASDYLYFNQDIAYFRDAAQCVLDSIKETILLNETDPNKRLPYIMKYDSRFKDLYVFYRKKEEFTVSQVIDLGQGEICPNYTEKVNIDWHMRPDRKKIEGYECQLAECYLFGRHWKAWFTESIPYPFGPYKFHGLPGLILQISDNTLAYDFTIKSLKQLKKERPLQLQKDQLMVNKKKYWELDEEFRYGVGIFYGAGAQPTEDFINGAKKTRAKEKAAENNPLELKPF